jgi:hypothetical protein
MNLLKVKFGHWCLLALAIVTIIGSGCASADSENMSARPWNSPGPNEGAIPSSLMEGR